jgi:hypothetical protein
VQPIPGWFPSRFWLTNRTGLVGDREGRFDWQQRFLLVNDATNRDCGYPSSVLRKDGGVLTVYYAVASKDHPSWGVHCGAVTYQVPARPGIAPGRGGVP